VTVSKHREGAQDAVDQAEFIRSWNADIYEQAQEKRAQNIGHEPDEDGGVPWALGPTLWTDGGTA
jgi:hypothetical protein